MSLLLFSYCGKDKPPTGGPRDTLPPRIIDTEPSDLTTNFSGDEIEFSFSEQIDLQSFKQAFRIYPLHDKIDFYWQPEKIRVKFAEKLQEKTLYYVTITSQCRDLRNNSLIKPYPLVFTTGDSIPDYRISGRVSTDPRLDEYKGEILVSLYSFDDSTLISRQALSKKFNYGFPYLDEGKYIVSAFKDKNGNRLFNPDNEFRDRKIISVNEKSEILNLQLTNIDEDSPQLKKIYYNSSQYAIIIFDENVKDYASLEIFEQVTRQKVNILDSFLHNDTLEVVTEPVDTSTYKLYMKELRDWKENSTTLDSLEFKETSIPDSSDFSLLYYSPPDGATIDSLRPSFRLRFNKIIAPDSLKIRFINMENESLVSVNIKRLNGKKYIITPQKNLRNYVPYKFVIEAESSDYEGNTLDKKTVINILPIIYQ